MKMITLEISTAAAHALLDATNDATLLKAIAKALAGAPAAAAPAEPKPAKAKASKPANDNKPAKRARKAAGDAVESAATLLAHMKSGTEYSAEALRSAADLDKPAFAKAVKILLDEGKVTRSGEKRGTKYAVA